MKKLYTLFFTLLLCSSNILLAATYTSASSGNWNSSSTWSPSGVPTTGDSVNIGNHTITVTSNAGCASITTLSGTLLANLVINSGVKLTLSGSFSVRPSNTANNDTYISGGGSLEVLNVVIGLDAINNTYPTITRSTTLYVDGLTLFKIKGNIISTTPVNTTPVAYNESRLRHRSGVIDLDGTLTVPTVSPGPAALGYRTDNDNQGASFIIFRNTDPTIPTDVQKAPSFTGGSVEYRSTATTNYTLPSLAYKDLILNSNRTFTSGGSSTSIVTGGSMNLKLGVLSSSAANQLRLNNGSTIYRSVGSFASGTNSRLRLATISVQYNVVYEQNSIPTVINDYPAYYPGSNVLNSIKTVYVNSTNGVVLNTNTIAVENLVINASCTISGTGNVYITDVLDIPNGSAVTFPDNFVHLKSSETKTARVAALPAGTVINGKIWVERYLPNNNRSWRLLTAPVKGSTVNSVWENWQNNGAYTGLDRGVDLWSPEGTLTAEDTGSTLQVSSIGNGLTYISNSSYNLRKFDNSLGTWSNVTNTLSQPLFTATMNQGFLLFASNSFLLSSNLGGIANTGSSQAVLSASGTLNIGDITYNSIASNKFYLIGNPYASPIDFKTVLAEPGNTGINKLWVIDPTIGYGSYVTWDAIAGYSNAGTVFSGSTILQSGQAFFVRSSSATTSLTIKESHKSSAESNTTINKMTSTKINGASALFRVLLEKQVDDVYSNRDGCVAAFYDGGTNGLDTNDGRKISNPSENLALFTNNFSLSIEHRASIVDNDYLTLRLTDAVVGINYKLKLYATDFRYLGNAYLKDLFTGTKTKLPLDESVFEYAFQVTSDAQSTGNRFEIVFQQGSSLNIADLATTNFSIYPNPANSHDSIMVLFHEGASSNNYSYKIYNTVGQMAYEGNFSTARASELLKLDGKLAAGLYFVEIRNMNNNERFTKKLIIK
ncbi:T9SS type A sorting domain-containing protein [Flavobacterium sp. Arc3]|uniref:T9SS type A sorting domain-containing protein n=1 Tax=Flavobacterium sp. Arc3 TaxID=3046686 RepID=UPI00352DC818